MVADDGLIISIKEARKKLPVKLRNELTDEQVQHLIVRLEAIAREFIRNTVPKST